jgi:lysine-specific demethylase/histidyl-hydroxylase NO66
MRWTMPTRTTRTPGLRTPARRAALARCVAPLEPERFLDEYWERRPLVSERGGAARFDDLLSERDIEELVASGGLRNPAFRLVKAGERLRLRDYSTDIPWRPSAFTGVADPEQVAEAFTGGATIVVQGLHHWWRPLAVFCRELEAELGQPTQANAYWTPRDSQGLPVHHDTHDVFVLQVAGEKRWLVYEPKLELPLRDQRYSDSMGEPGEPVHDVVLRAGDMLYMPRGWLHQAMTSATDSLHLTVGVNVYTWIDAARAALRRAESDVEWRRSVPADGEGGRELAELLGEHMEPEDVVRRMRRRFVSSRRPVSEDPIAQLRALDRVTADSEVERRPTVIAELLTRRNGLVLGFEGKTLRLPAAAGEALEELVTGEGPMRPRDLPGELDEESRLVLVRRLVREGFLRVVEPGA